MIFKNGKNRVEFKKVLQYFYLYTMSGTLPDFEYDIFISYRHNDNLDGWVTNFIQSLEKELRSTIKEPVSVYFDSNLRDGLHETHDVDDSLKGKLRCLIFIPIISHTYCDPKSFAWQKEFLAFKKLASEDRFGLKIKLQSGNVASRILPVRIHDLDPEDKQLLEAELGGILRSIDFIYKSAGVNRPLTPKEDELRITGQVLYRDQENKVAIAIKEIITSLKRPTKRISESKQIQYTTLSDSNFKLSKEKIIFTTLGLMILFVLIFGVSQFIETKGESGVIDKSIAVLPFVNMSSDPEQEYFSDGLSEALGDLLAKIKELKVIARTSSFSFKGKNIDVRTIGESLGVAHILEGSVQKSGNKIRVTAQLIKTSDGSHLWSETYEREIDDIFKMQDEIAQYVVKELKVNLMVGEKMASARPKNMEAYKLYLQGRYYYFQSDPKALEAFQAALKIDSLYAKAWAGMASQWHSMGSGTLSYLQVLEKARGYALRALSIEPNEPDAIGAMAFIYFIADHNYAKAEQEVLRGLQIDPNNNNLLIALCQINIALGNTRKAEDIALKLVEIDPINPFAIITHARSYWAQKKLTDAEREFKTAYELSPKNYIIPYSLGLISLEKGNAAEALDRLVNKNTENFVGCRIAASMAYFALGRKKESDEILQWAKGYGIASEGEIANCYAFRNEKDQAFQWINKAIDQNETTDLLIVSPGFFFNHFKNDPRHKEIYRRLNIPL